MNAVVFGLDKETRSRLTVTQIKVGVQLSCSLVFTSSKSDMISKQNIIFLANQICTGFKKNIFSLYASIYKIDKHISL